LAKKQYKRRMTLFGTISVIVILIFIYNLFSYISLINKLDKEQKDLENKLVELRKDISDKKEEIEKLKNPIYLAKYARENFLYSKDGEYIIRIDEQERKIDEIEEKTEYRQKVIMVLSISLILIVLVYMILKIRKRSLE